MNWSEMTREQRTEAVEPLARKGLSATQIAMAVGCPSRNAILGHIHRYGLAWVGRGRTTAEIRAEAAARARLQRRRQDEKLAAKVGRARQKAKSQGKARVPLVPEFKVDPVDREHCWRPLDGSAPRPLHEVGEHECKWCIGDPFADGPSLFCGQPARDGSSWCPTHHAMAWRPLPARALSKKLRRAA